jgi:hypothetical protein
MGNTNNTGAVRGGVVINNKIIISVAQNFLKIFEDVYDQYIKKTNVEPINNLKENFKTFCKNIQVPKNYIYINDLTNNPNSLESKLAEVLGIENIVFWYGVETLYNCVLYVPANGLRSSGRKGSLKHSILGNFTKDQLSKFPEDCNFSAYKFQTSTKVNVMFYNCSSEYNYENVSCFNSIFSNIDKSYDFVTRSQKETYHIYINKIKNEIITNDVIFPDEIIKQIINYT